MLTICFVQAKAWLRSTSFLSWLGRFNIKDQGAKKQILGMEIDRDRKDGKIWLS